MAPTGMVLKWKSKWGTKYGPGGWPWASQNTVRLSKPVADLTASGRGMVAATPGGQTIGGSVGGFSIRADGNRCPKREESVPGAFPSRANIGAVHRAALALDDLPLATCPEPDDEHADCNSGEKGAMVT